MIEKRDGRSVAQRDLRRHEAVMASARQFVCAGRGVHGGGRRKVIGQEEAWCRQMTTTVLAARRRECWYEEGRGIGDIYGLSRP